MSDTNKPTSPQQQPTPNMGGAGFLKLPRNIKRPDRRDEEEEEKNAK